MGTQQRSVPLLRMLGHTTVTLLLSTLVYVVVPLRLDRSYVSTLGRLGVVVAALVLLVLLFRVHLRRSAAAQERHWLRVQWLLATLYGLVLLFALAYAALAAAAPGQFTGIEDRLDALYFSVTLVATVGFGDVHASGSAARLLVTVHMVFNLVYLGTAIRVLSSRTPLLAPSPAEGGPGTTGGTGGGPPA